MREYKVKKKLDKADCIECFAFLRNIETGEFYETKIDGRKTYSPLHEEGLEITHEGELCSFFDDGHSSYGIKCKDGRAVHTGDVWKIYIAFKNEDGDFVDSQGDLMFDLK